MSITGVPASIVAGATVQATVTALDVNGNTVTGFTGQTADITFSTLGGVYPATVTFTNGVAILSFTPNAESSSSTVTVSGDGATATATFAVTSAAATQLVVTPTSVSISGEFPFSITATEDDAYGNVVPSSIAVTITPATGGAGATGPATAISGSSPTFTANNTPGQYTIVFSAAGLTPVTVTVTNTVSMQYLVTVLTDSTNTPTGTLCVEQTSGTGDNSQCSLREAINAANQQNGSIITFAPGLVTAASPVTIALNTNYSDLEIDDPASIVGPGSRALIVDDTGGSSAFDLEANTVLSGITIHNAPYSGLYNDATSILNDITFQTNNGPISGNVGGGLYNDGTLTVTNSSFLNNTQNISGSAAYNDGILTMSNITFQGSSSTQVGGALYNDNGKLQVTNSVFSGNISPDGGAIYTDGNSTSLTTVQSSTFSGNNDMAIDATAPIVIADSTFSGNTSATVAAVHIGTGSTGSVIRNTTINGNTVTGGGATAVSVDSGASLTVQNSIVAGNGGSATSTGNCSNCTLAGNNVIDVNPDLLALGNYGSPTPQVPALQTMLPMPGSPAICAGAFATDTTDERGYPRPTVSGTTSCYDIGAVQTAYALAFTQQPTDTLVSSAITPAPAVQLTEQAADVSGIPVVMAASTGTLSGAASQTTDATGTATFGDLSFSAANAETLTATVGTLSVTSNSFDVTAPTPPPAPTAAVTVANQQVNAGSPASLMEYRSESELDPARQLLKLSIKSILLRLLVVDTLPAPQDQRLSPLLSCPLPDHRYRSQCSLMIT